ncbi:MAG: response regulator [Thermodesulfobacteriota bacterium]
MRKTLDSRAVATQFRQRRGAIIPNVKIAVVDDDKPTREFVANVLMYCVNRVVLAFENGAALLAHLEDSNSIDIVLSDVEMPQMDGLTLLSKFKQQYPDKICIIMSGNNEYEKDAKKLGADAFLAKPFKVNDLFDIVKMFVVGTP